MDEGVSNTFKFLTILNCMQAFCSIGFNFLLFGYLVHKHYRKRVNYQQKGSELILCSMLLANLLFSLGSVCNFLALMICGDCTMSNPSFKVLNIATSSCFVVQYFHIILLAIERLVSMNMSECHQEFKTNLIIMNLVLVWLLSLVPILLFEPGHVGFLLTSAVVMIVLDFIVLTIVSYVIRLLKKRISDEEIQFRVKVLSGKMTATVSMLIIFHIICNIPFASFILLQQQNPLFQSGGDTAAMVIEGLVLLQTIADPLIYICRHHIFWKFNNQLFFISSATNSVDDVIEAESATKTQAPSSASAGSFEKKQLFTTSSESSLDNSSSLSQDILSTTVFV